MVLVPAWTLLTVRVGPLVLHMVELVMSMLVLVLVMTRVAPGSILLLIRTWAPKLWWATLLCRWWIPDTRPLRNPRLLKLGLMATTRITLNLLRTLKTGLIGLVGCMVK